jgi:TetR/AcrR family transcriptional regulator
MPASKQFSSVSKDAPLKRERRKDARPGELLEAALDLFVEKGFAGTRAEEVALRAGVSKGTLFLYFSSKEELFKAVVREYIGSHLRDGLELLAVREEPAAELLAYCLGQWWLRYGATKASGITKLMMSEAANFPELAAFYQQEVILPWRALIRGVLQRGVDQGEFVIEDIDSAVSIVMAPLMFLIMWQHAMKPCSAATQQIDPARFLKSQIDILLRGVLAPTHGLRQGKQTVKTIKANTA